MHEKPNGPRTIEEVDDGFAEKFRDHLKILRCSKNKVVVASRLERFNSLFEYVSRSNDPSK